MNCDWAFYFLVKHDVIFYLFVIPNFNFFSRTRNAVRESYCFALISLKLSYLIVIFYPVKYISVYSALWLGTAIRESSFRDFKPFLPMNGIRCQAVHTTPLEFENGGFSLKTHQVFSAHNAPEEI